MKDIAKDLGVSLMTVSKALRNHSDISDETRDRVLKRAAELNYQPNWIAQSLVTRKTYLIGLVIPDLMHSFFAEVAKGVARKLGVMGYQIVISNTEENETLEERHLNLLIARKVDGLILASAQRSGRAEVFRNLEASKVPYVLIDRMVSGMEANFVGVKDADIGCLATTHLIEQGCRRIAHIRGPNVATGVGRLRGYRHALAQHGLKPLDEYVVGGGSGDHTGYEAMRELLKIQPRPDGVFCYNDPVAAGAIKAALEAGLSVPEDVAIIGAGNVHYSDLLRVPLSTIDQSSTLIGEAAAELLSECMSSKSALRARRIFLTPKVVARDSTRRVNGQ
jgi:LacI family transcriptional regulator